ncbi:hypothetical protein GWN26_10490 [Candidatus Saccharibacteria bacterium]|nr:hypothetical protein [Candidatus Saccharibacteria bacterium]
MHKDFIPTEVAAGRVEVIEPKIPEKKEFVPELAQFSFEVSDFYGSGSMDKLMTNLSRLRKELLQEFAETRLSVEIPDSVSNKRILNQIKTLVMTAHGMAEQSEKQEEDKEDDTDQ